MDLAEWWNKGPSPSEKFDRDIAAVFGAVILIPAWLLIIAVVIWFFVTV